MELKHDSKVAIYSYASSATPCALNCLTLQISETYVTCEKLKIALHQSQIHLHGQQHSATNRMLNLTPSTPSSLSCAVDWMLLFQRDPPIMQNILHSSAQSLSIYISRTIPVLLKKKEQLGFFLDVIESVLICIDNYSPYTFLYLTMVWGSLNISHFKHCKYQ